MAIRRTANAMATVVTVTKPSGITETARLSIVEVYVSMTNFTNTPSIQYLKPMLIVVFTSFFHAKPIPTTRAHSPTARTIKYCPSFASFLWIGVVVRFSDPELIAMLTFPIYCMSAVTVLSYDHHVHQILKATPYLCLCSGANYNPLCSSFSNYCSHKRISFAVS